MLWMVHTVGLQIVPVQCHNITTMKEPSMGTLSLLQSRRVSGCPLR